MNKANIANRPQVGVGDRVRVMLKPKSFRKGYAPKWSSDIHTIDAKEGKYYIINSTTRKKWLRAFLQLVGDVEETTIPADLSGTVEGRLKELAKKPITEDSRKEAQKMEDQLEQAIEERTQTIKRRTRGKKIDYSALSKTGLKKYK